MNWVREPWGSSLIWTRTDRYAGKLLKINRGQSLSLQYHKEKDESIYVLRGRLQLEVRQGNIVSIAVLKAGTAYDIPAGTIHRFQAPFGQVELVEVSAGLLNDVVRLEDRYGRV